MGYLRHDADDRAYTCPHCGGQRLYQREGRGNAHVGDPEDDVACYECGETFARGDVVVDDFRSAKPPMIPDDDTVDHGGESWQAHRERVLEQVGVEQ